MTSNGCRQYPANTVTLELLLVIMVSFNQTLARKQRFLASDWFKFGTLPKSTVYFNFLDFGGLLLL